MKFLIIALWMAIAVGSLSAGGFAAEPERALPAQQVAAPAPESLKFRLLWPSGLALGEGVLASSMPSGQVRLTFTVEVELPTFRLSASFTSVATQTDLCSLQYHRNATEGAKVVEESIEFDQTSHQAHRTFGGETSALSIPNCARDPLVFLYYFRRQLAAGKPADVSTFFAGTGSSLEIKPAGTETVSVGGVKRNAEKFLVTYRRPRRETTFELWTAADAARTPLLIRLPSSLATFSAELE